MSKKDEKLAATGSVCFQQFLASTIVKISKTSSWDLLARNVVKAFHVTTPVELLLCELTDSEKVPFSDGKRDWDSNSDLSEALRSPNPIGDTMGKQFFL